MITETRYLVEILCKGDFLKKTSNDVMYFLALTARMIESCEENQGIKQKIDRIFRKKHGYGKTYPPDRKAKV